MCKVPSSKLPVKSRTAHLSPKGESGRYILTLSQDKTATVYWLSVLEADFGLAYRLEKFSDGSTYDINVCLADPRHSSCECLGFLRWGHKTICKHVACLVALRSSGRI
jgi:hypothetical protein